MNLYLVQHGDALAKDVDPDRPLSPKGLADMKRIAAWCSRRLIVEGVFHSGKTRAGQTAQMMAKAIGSCRISELSGINPNDSVEAFQMLVESWTEDSLVVGHLPFMSKAVGQFLLGDESRELACFSPGTVICLVRGAPWEWKIGWLLRPDMPDHEHP